MIAPYTHRSALAVAAALTALVGARVATVWSRLPPVLASHFDINGEPDGWMARGSFFVTLAGIGGGTIVPLLFAPLWLGRLPADAINLPNRDYWMAAERRQATVTRLGAWIAWIAVATLALLVSVVELSLRANLAQAPLDGYTTAALGAYASVMVGLLLGCARGFRRPV